MKTQTEAEILLSKQLSFIDVTRKEPYFSLTASCFELDPNELAPTVKSVADYLKAHGVSVVNYRVQNGFRMDDIKAEKLNARDYSNFNFLLLNKMLEVPEPKTLEGLAA